MRPCGCARKPTDVHTSSRTHSRTYTYIHPRTHVYARIRAREGNFLTPNLLYSIIKPSSIISPTAFTSIIQSLYNPYQCCHYIGCVICTNCHYLSFIYKHLPTIRRASVTNLPIIITTDHYLELYIHIISSLSNFQSNQLTVLSICQYVIKPYQFSIY